MARDIIRAFVDALEREGVPAALAERVADRVRSEWGGERAYVLKGSGQPRAEKKTAAVGAGFLAGLTTRQMSEVYGWPLRTVQWHARRRRRLA